MVRRAGSKRDRMPSFSNDDEEGIVEFMLGSNSLISAWLDEADGNVRPPQEHLQGAERLNGSAVDFRSTAEYSPWTPALL
jgi:hypothetical protein